MNVGVLSNTQTQTHVTLSVSQYMRTWTHELNLQSCSESHFRDVSFETELSSQQTIKIKVWLTLKKYNRN